MTKVLVADDERHIRDLLVDILVDRGYDVVEATDGSAAYELTCRMRPDVVLLDVMMPGMDGFKVLQKLRKNPATENVPVVMLTAMSASRGESLAMRLGVDHYITKPFKPATVESAVRIALRDARAAPEEDMEGRPSTVWQGTPTIIRTADKLVPLEKQLGGGIPLGSLTLIEGASSSGKSVLCQHLTYGALQSGLGAAYFSSESTARALIDQMGSIGLGVSNYVSADMLRIYPLEAPAPGISADHPNDPERLLA